ncbi:MAG: EFR1 family ferrodoxin [Candidatus Hermodarchaeota archaeon]
MKTTIYYFSGTGNSLKIAKEITERLEDTELIPIAKIWEEKNIESKNERIGFIFPLYWSGLPKIVHEFIDKINVTNSNYFFSVVTSTGDINEQPLQQLDRLLNKKAKKLNAGFYVDMPNNYILGFDIHSNERQKEFFENSIKQVKNILDIVNKQEDNITEEILGKDVSRSAKLNKNFRDSVYESDKAFHVNDDCNNCGICEKVCPMNNIILKSGIPEWQHKCQQCLACINFCPEKAIQYGEKTQKTQRYYHPDITFRDIAKQK